MIERSSLEQEIKNRIDVAVYAYSYEIEHESLISDAEYDKLALSINPQVQTGNKVMDDFFLNEFDPCTGSWIYNHPNIEMLKRIYHIKRDYRENMLDTFRSS
jgi:hypothetical protein